MPDEGCLQPNPAFDHGKTSEVSSGSGAGFLCAFLTKTALGSESRLGAHRVVRNRHSRFRPNRDFERLEWRLMPKADVRRFMASATIPDGGELNINALRRARV